MYLLYSFTLTTFLLLALPFFLYRGLRSGKYRSSLRERLGFLPPSLNRGERVSIWVHAVSVGEVVAARTLIPLLRESFPGKPVFVSVTTQTGRQVADRQLREADGVFYCPFDWRFVVRRVVERIRPCALFVMETEIWPHLLRVCHESGAATFLVNGRISDRSYPRYRFIRPFMRRFLRHVDCFCMQSARYADRVIDLGADPDRVKVTGSLKFDAAVPEIAQAAEAARLVPSGRPVLLAGSTLAPEEEILLETFVALRKERPDLFLILAPRHPERFDEVAELAASRTLQLVRRSSLERSPNEADVMLLDTLGELASLYSSADVVFMGGSLAPWGGHNVIEPAAVGKPVVFGPHMSNFREIASTLLEGKAAMQVENREELRNALRRLFDDPSLRACLGDKARRLVEANRGAGRKTMALARTKLHGAT
ncbi:MAG: 3-deoxy-D-manno-octulosonic acid transferase [Acidobacteriota bacterium]